MLKETKEGREKPNRNGTGRDGTGRWCFFLVWLTTVGLKSEMFIWTVEILMICFCLMCVNYSTRSTFNNYNSANPASQFIFCLCIIFFLDTLCNLFYPVGLEHFSFYYVHSIIQYCNSLYMCIYAHN